VGDSDLAGSGQVQVTRKSTTQPAGITLTLPEFGRFGIFRGTFSIVATNSANPSGELRAANGDTILASYLDAGGASVTFTARVETVVPTISNRGIEEGYVDAFVYWDTSEPCDALVQFGESPLLGRTAYVPTLGTSHEVYLDGLEPDRLYYYQIVSRDNAGNVRVDNNGGNLHTFHTLTPLTPPWFDNLEANADNWFVYTPELESELQWEYGVPNVAGVTAYSGTKVWASNLDGVPAGFVESYLISPAIYLTGGNRAILRFWHNYDFTVGEDDFFHLGELAIVTNANTEPITLDVYEDELSGGWEEAEYDLSPHAGKLVYLVWHYVYFSFSSTAPQGWVIDDISLTMSNTAAGILRVTNNLSQAAFTITGPMNITAQGNSFITTNAPPGQYTVTWGPVAYWQTPLAQSNILVAPGTTVFTGNYTITDANNNGMSDSWEQAWFGSVAPGRTEFTDTDNDGMTDRAEFFAGTIPTNGFSVLKFLSPAVQNTGAVRLDWLAVPGRSYRITSAGSSMTNWIAATDWMRANGNLLSFTTNVTAGTRFYRLEVRP
jgi:hypothetical protein